MGCVFQRIEGALKNEGEERGNATLAVLSRGTASAKLKPSTRTISLRLLELILDALRVIADKGHDKKLRRCLVNQGAC
jgi:hypothetical protein